MLCSLEIQADAPATLGAPSITVGARRGDNIQIREDQPDNAVTTRLYLAVEMEVVTSVRRRKLGSDVFLVVVGKSYQPELGRKKVHRDQLFLQPHQHSRPVTRGSFPCNRFFLRTVAASHPSIAGMLQGCFSSRLAGILLLTTWQCGTSAKKAGCGILIP
jgi:hypothetical protein